MITVIGWVLALVALGVAGHFFGVDSRDADYTARVSARTSPAAADRPRPARAAAPIR